MSEGFEIISVGNINVKAKIDLIDKAGYKYQSTIDYMRNAKKKPRMFHKSNIYTIDNIKLYYKLNNSELTVLSNEYLGDDNPMKFQCKCGSIFDCSWGQMRTTGKISCNDCVSISKTDKLKADIDKVKICFVEKGLHPLFDEYENSHVGLYCKDKDEYQYSISYSNLQRRSNFDKFDKRNPFTIENIKRYIVINEYPCKLISTEWDGNSGVLWLKCACGENYKTNWNRFIRDTKVRCKKCAKSQSKYEYIVEKYLNDINANYDKQVKMPGCVHIKPLSFDFKLNVGSSFILIEVDGEVHYRGFMGKPEALESTKVRDDIKNNYCKNNNIPLLRIPYWEISKNKYIEIINNKMIEINAS